MKKFFIIASFSIFGIILIAGATFGLLVLSSGRVPKESEQDSWICYVTGKSGGHLFPALALAKQQVTRQQTKVLFFSTDTPLDRLIIKKSPHVSVHETLSLRNVPRGNILAWPGYCLDLIRVAVKITRTLAYYRPSTVVSMGGYISVPVGLIAWLLRIPIHVYELNVVPGSAVKFLSKFATTTFTCFKETAALLPHSAHIEQTTYPIRFTNANKLSKADAHTQLGIKENRAVVLVIGGSQGSRFINDLVPHALATHKNVFVLHQTGVGEVERVEKLYAQNGIQALVFAFRDDINILYSASDLVIARAGAGSLFESVFFKTPSLIVPLETEVTDHQLDNALAMEKQYPELFTVLRQQEIDTNPDLFTQKLSTLLH